MTNHSLSNRSTLALNIALVSPKAREWIKKAASARVLNVFDRACNLIDDEGRILSIVASEIGAGPFSAVLCSDLEESSGFNGFSGWVDTTSTVRVKPDTILFGGLQVNTKYADEWNPSFDWPQVLASRERWSGSLPGIQRIMEIRAPQESLYQIVDAVISEATEDLQDLAIYDLIQRHAIRPARTLCEGILTNNDPAIREGARGLAGLGGGLTPAGDDFIMGVLMGLKSITLSESISPIAETIISTVKPRTTPLSAAWIQSAADGEMHETWHHFFHALLQESDVELQVAVGQILDTGHSSGADAMAGFLTVILMPANKNS